MLEDSPTITYSDLARRKDTKKDGAQKFYSLLVLQKVFSIIEENSLLLSIPTTLFQFQAVEMDQDQNSIYADLNIGKGACFDTDATLATAAAR